MQYIAALDYEHLDNGMFLTALAKSIAQQENVQLILIHGDSPYTDRIMQGGVMREEAKILCIKSLNHRLINLFADEGVSAVGINGYQRKLITQEENRLTVDAGFFKALPPGPILLISNLVWDTTSSSPIPVSLSRMATFLHEELKSESIFAFSRADKDEIIISEKPEELRWHNLPEEFARENLPEEFHHFNQPLRLTTARDFNEVPANSHSILIH